MVASSHADAIGLNFYSSGKRYVDPATAKSIVDELSQAATKLVTVGVFVDDKIEEVASIAAALSLDVIQLHGDQTPDDLRLLKSWIDDREFECDVIRAIRTQPHDGMSAMNLAEVNAEIQLWQSAGIDAILIDAAVAGHFGGTGKQVDWAGFAALRSAVPKILAGGLNPDNVSGAIKTASPAAVDVASGVERTAGQKDEPKTRSFADSALTAFASNAP